MKASKMKMVLVQRAVHGVLGAHKDIKTACGVTGNRIKTAVLRKEKKSSE